jgi:hypothetical protein
LASKVLKKGIALKFEVTEKLLETAYKLMTVWREN